MAGQNYMGIFNRFTLIAAFCTCTVAMQAADVACSEIATHNQPALIKILEETPPEEPPPCVTQVIKRLGELHRREAIPVLLKYLAYKREMSELEKEGIFLRSGDWYPAVNALFDIGKPAVPHLLVFLRNASPGTTAFSQAVEAFMAIHREDTLAGIQLLVESARKTEDPYGRKSLYRAARDAAARLCWPPRKDQSAQQRRLSRSENEELHVGWRASLLPADVTSVSTANWVLN